MTVEEWNNYIEVVRKLGEDALQQGGTCGIKFDFGVKKVQADEQKNTVKFENDGTATVAIQLTGIFDNPFGGPE